MMTEPTVSELRADLLRIRAEGGFGSASRGLEAFDRLAAAAAATGRPLDVLSVRSPVESERFFAHTIQGPDGHVYWDSASREPQFTRNDGMSRTPLRWWWEHVHGPLPNTTMRVKPICGEPRCINIAHAECKPFQVNRYTDMQMLGALQVMAMRLGMTPTKDEWEDHGGRPVSASYYLRFGSWPKAIRAAGLEPRYEMSANATREGIAEALRYVRDRLGHWPLSREFRSLEMRAELKARGLPTSHNLIAKYFGTLADARKELE